MVLTFTKLHECLTMTIENYCLHSYSSTSQTLDVYMTLSNCTLLLCDCMFGHSKVFILYFSSPCFGESSNGFGLPLPFSRE